MRSVDRLIALRVVKALVNVRWQWCCAVEVDRSLVIKAYDDTGVGPLDDVDQIDGWFA
jgi:hypothetical protein